MLGRLALFTTRRPRLVLAVVTAFVIVASALGSGVITRLTNGGFTDPASPSAAAQDVLAREFHTGSPNFVLLVTAPGGDRVDSPGATASGRRLVARLAEDGAIGQVVSPWGPDGAALVSHDHRQALVTARVVGDEDAALESARRLKNEYGGDVGGLRVQTGGTLGMTLEVQKQLEKDLTRAEMYSMPVLLLLLVLVFGGIVPAALPLVVGGVAIVGTLMSLRLLTMVTDVSVFAINLTTALGLGLAIDYSLFLLSRYREERNRGLESHDAIIRAVSTAGRTIVFSGITVAACLLVLLIFPLVFLKSFAYAGLAVVLIALAAALFVLPPLVMLLGRRVERRGRHRGRAQDPAAQDGGRASYPPGTGFWGRQAARAMDHHIVAGGLVVAALLALGSPFLGVQFGLPDPRVQPTSAQSRQVFEEVHAGFTPGELSPLTVVAPHTGKVPGDRVGRYAASLSRLPGVARVDASVGSYADGRQVAPATPLSRRFATDDATWLSVVPSNEPTSVRGERLVADVRATPSPFPTLVGGAAAELVDTKAALGDRLPFALGAMALVTFVILFLFTGGVLIPVKALVLNVLSLSATVGALVWIFQEGHLSGLLGFTSTGTLDTNMPILMFCLAFGLSMDYEIFLLSRIKEEHDMSGDNRRAVIRGLDSTGPLVSAAAVLLAVVFLGLATSQISFLKLLGIGAALAVVMDATVVRGVLVPAAMQLAGEASWWAPPWLRRLHDRLGLAEEGPAARPVAAPPVLPVQREAPGVPAPGGFDGTADDTMRVPAHAGGSREGAS
jgi:putative drug exporter of the RND superfamily